MKFDERNQNLLKIPPFYFHGNCGKVCPTDSDFLAYLVPLDELLSLPNNGWRLIVFAPFLIIIIIILLSFFPLDMNMSRVDFRNYRTEFHETWWSYRYMFLVDQICGKNNKSPLPLCCSSFDLPILITPLISENSS
jgi:hypothetical protein